MADLYSDIPELSAEQAGIARRRKIAEAIQAQSMKPLESQQIPGGYVVPTSPLLGIGKVLEAYMASKGLKEADTAEKGLADKYKGMEEDAIKSYKTKFNDQVNPYPVNDQMSPEAQQFAQADGQQIVPGDKLGAVKDALLSKFENLNKMGVLDWQNLQSDETRKENIASRAEATRIAAEARADTLAETTRHNKEMENLSGSRITAGLGPNGTKLTKGQEAVDKEFGKEYATWTAGGGYTDTLKQLKQLQRVSEELATLGNDYTGGMVGLIPDKMRNLTNPNAVAAQKDVQDSVQRGMRAILGAQYTQKEGENLMDRAYDPQAEPSVNARRVNAIIRQMRVAAKDKQDATKYFEENGSLVGWKGKVPTFSDFESAIDAEGGDKKAAQFDADKESRYQAWKANQGK